MDKPENTQTAPEVRKGQVPIVRALLLAAVLAGATALVYFTQLAGLEPVGGNRPALWLFVALGIWAACAQPVAIRNRQSSLSTQLTEIPALVGIVFLSPWLALDRHNLRAPRGQRAGDECSRSKR